VPKRSAGILLYRRCDDELQVLLVHPGGPLWAKKDHGVWSIPKGEYGDDEHPFEAARREFLEELGSTMPDGPAIDLGEVRLKSGKLVRAWSIEGDLDAAAAVSNTFWLEWPPRSGRQIEVPENDRAEWFGIDQARERVNPSQVALLDRLIETGV
jgi:predicted NUDIX family NTP pyrophosphohydrolase